MTPNVDTTDPILYAQESVADFLAAKPYFQNIPVIKADTGNVLDMIDQTVAKTGLCIILEPGTATFAYQGSAIAMECPLRIIVWENVTRNRSSAGTRKRASAVAVEIVKALKPATPAPPVVVTEAELTRDSGDECVYTLNTRNRIAL